MPTTIGVNCNSEHAYVAVAVDGQIEDRRPDRLELPALEDSERLAVFVDDTAGELQSLGATGMSVLKHQHMKGMPVRVAALENRVVLETLMRLAAVKAGLPVEMTHPRTVRSRLGCGAEGGLDQHLDEVLPDAVGQYWRAGRGLAAMAALALQRA